MKDLHNKKNIYIFFRECMYKMSSGAERLTKERKMTVETYTKNKINTICIKKRCNCLLCSLGKNDRLTKTFSPSKFMSCSNEKN